jgi:hypothetical protein
VHEVRRRSTASSSTVCSSTAVQIVLVLAVVLVLLSVPVLVLVLVHVLVAGIHMRNVPCSTAEPRASIEPSREGADPRPYAARLDATRLKVPDI